MSDHRKPPPRDWTFHPFEMAFCGYSGTGKTTLLSRLVPALGMDLAYIKHGVHGFQMDRPGKDTDIMTRAGAGTVFISDPAGRALLRSGARVGDEIWVSGTLGDARLALDVLYGRLSVPPEVFNPARARLETPSPRVALGMALRGVASAAIDVSDGLLGDLGHILTASQVGAVIDTSIATKLIASHAYWMGAEGLFGIKNNQKTGLKPCLAYVLAGGDDYELLFTAPVAHRDAVLAAARVSALPVTRIGQVQSTPGLRLVDENGAEVTNTFRSFDHFA